MTAQAREILWLGDTARPMTCTPLAPWLEARSIDLRQRSDGYTTALWRGYLGCWELHRGRLHLIGLLDHGNQPFDTRQALDTSPDGTGRGGPALPLRADWFTGRLDLPDGPDLAYGHFGWGCTSRWQDSLYIVNGRLVKQRRFDLGKALRRQWQRMLADLADEQQTPEPDIRIPRLEWLLPAGRQLLGLPLEPGDAQALDAPAEPWFQEYATDHLAHCVRPAAEGDAAQAPR